MPVKMTLVAILTIYNSVLRRCYRSLQWSRYCSRSGVCVSVEKGKGFPYSLLGPELIPVYR